MPSNMGISFHVQLINFLGYKPIFCPSYRGVTQSKIGSSPRHKRIALRVFTNLERVFEKRQKITHRLV